MTATVSRPERALQRIQALRFRRRRVRALDGVLRLVGLLVLIVWVTFLVDWSLDLPLAVRMLTAAAALTFLFLGLRVFVLTTRRRVTDAWLAAQVESAADLEQSLLTAIQLAGSDNPRTALYSPMLLDRTVRDAERRVEQIEMAGLVSRRGLISSLAVLTVLAAPLLAGAWARPDLARTYVERDVLFRRVPWPRVYFLEVESPAEVETLIAMGDPLVILVRKERGGEARVNLNVDFADGGRESFTLEKKGSEEFRKVFRNVTRDFSFWITCGDFRSELYRISVRNRPRIETIHVEFEYPEYTGLNQLSSDAASPSRNLGGHVKVPLGTQVRYQARTSIPVSRAIWVNEYQSGGESQVGREELEILGERELAGSFEAVRNGSYYFELFSEDGFRNPSPIRYRIAVIPDQPPGVQILKPGRNTEVSPRAQFDVTLEASDDYGLSGGRLVVRLDDGGERSDELPVVQDRAIAELASREKRAELSVPLDLEPLSLHEGQRLEYHAQATDAQSQVGQSRTYVLTIVAEDELMRILQDELTLIRETLEQCLDWQKSSRSEVEGVVEVTLAGSRLRSTDLPNLRHARLTQERVEERVAEVVVRLEELIERSVENRLVWKELPRVESIRDRLARIAEELAPPALRLLNEVVRLAEKATREQVVSAMDSQRSLERALTDLLTDLREWGDLRSLIRKVEELLSTQKELEEHIERKFKESRGQGGQ